MSYISNKFRKVYINTTNIIKFFNFLHKPMFELFCTFKYQRTGEQFQPKEREGERGGSKFKLENVWMKNNQIITRG